MGAEWLADWGLFAGVMALGQFSPGPDMILLTRVSLRDGRRAGFLVVLGIVSGLCIHAALAIGGMSALLAQGGTWEKIMSALAAAYLMWLGRQMIGEFFRTRADTELHKEPDRRGGSWYFKGLLCNLLNPKVVVFFAGVTAVFLKGERESWWPALLWATIVLEGLLLWGAWVVVLQRKTIREFYLQQGKWLELAFGTGLWILAVMLLLTIF